MQSSTTAICFVLLLGVFDVDSTTVNDGRIYNGDAITISHSPYMAQVLLPFTYCGGGILREDLILTAGHCVMNPKTLKVRDAGDYVILVGATGYRDYENGQRIFVQNVYPHPDYKGLRGNNNHDIGILRLASKIRMGWNTQLIKLAFPGEETPSGREVIVSGWGRNAQDHNDMLLFQAKMKIFSYPKCAKIYRAESEEFKKHKICAKAVRGKPCGGDSGDPLIDTKTDRVVGLDSYGKGGCEVDVPVVFTKIIDNLDFINRIMSQNGSDQSNEIDLSFEPSTDN